MRCMLARLTVTMPMETQSAIWLMTMVSVNVDIGGGQVYFFVFLHDGFGKG